MLFRVALLLFAVTCVCGAKPHRSLLQQSSQISSGPTDGPQAEVTVLPALPYSTDALEPYIDNTTTTLHYSRHAQAFVTQLRFLVGNDTQLAAYNLADLQRVAGTDIVSSTAATSLINNGGGAWNHAFFFKSLTPPGTFQSGYDQAASQNLKDAINYAFGDFSTFQRNFTIAATGVFGSGWAWLIATDHGLQITTTPNQNNPLQTNLANATKTTVGIPVLGIDVWEHAYYLKHYNIRANYISDFFYVINWAQISDNYMYAAAGKVPSTAAGPLATSYPVSG